MNLQQIVDRLRRFAVGACAGDQVGIVALYGPDGTAEIPVCSPVRREIESTRSIHVGSELAERVEIPGAACSAGSQAAVTMKPTIARANGLIAVDLAGARRV